MFNHSVGSVLVIDDGYAEGIVTARDLVNKILTENGTANLFDDPSAASKMTAQEVMTADPVTVDQDLEFPKVLRERERDG